MLSHIPYLLLEIILTILSADVLEFTDLLRMRSVNKEWSSLIREINNLRLKMRRLDLTVERIRCDENSTDGHPKISAENGTDITVGGLFDPMWSTISKRNIGHVIDDPGLQRGILSVPRVAKSSACATT
jgi:hypothetical protein